MAKLKFGRNLPKILFGHGNDYVSKQAQKELKHKLFTISFILLTLFLFFVLVVTLTELVPKLKKTDSPHFIEQPRVETKMVSTPTLIHYDPYPLVLQPIFMGPTAGPEYKLANTRFGVVSLYYTEAFSDLPNSSIFIPAKWRDTISEERLTTHKIDTVLDKKLNYFVYGDDISTDIDTTGQLRSDLHLDLLSSPQVVTQLSFNLGDKPFESVNLTFSKPVRGYPVIIANDSGVVILAYQTFSTGLTSPAVIAVDDGTHKRVYLSVELANILLKEYVTDQSTGSQLFYKILYWLEGTNYSITLEQTPQGKDKVMLIRIDDVNGAEKSTTGKKAPLSLLINYTNVIDKYSQKITFAVIPSLFNITPSDNPNVIAYLRAKVNAGAEVSLHGYTHELFTDYSYPEQVTRIKLGKTILMPLFNITSFTLPSYMYHTAVELPYPTGNLLAASKNNGIYAISGNLRNTHFNKWWLDNVSDQFQANIYFESKSNLLSLLGNYNNADSPILLNIHYASAQQNLNITNNNKKKLIWKPLRLNQYLPNEAILCITL